MRIRDRIPVIFLLILVSVATSSGANYIGGTGSVPPNAMLASDGNGTNAQIRGIGNTEQHHEDRRSSS